MDLHAVDARLFALVTAATVATIFVLKKLFPKLVEDKEEAWAIILPALFVVIAKVAKQFHGTDWIDALLWAFGSGVTAGVGHDYALKPGTSIAKTVLAKVVGFFVKAPSTSGEPPPPAGDTKV